jgi:hypothetical protein
MSILIEMKLQERDGYFSRERVRERLTRKFFRIRNAPMLHSGLRGAPENWGVFNMNARFRPFAESLVLSITRQV